MTTKDRLLEYIQYKGITQRAFCRKAGLSENLLSSKSWEFFDSTIEKIRESYIDLNIDWVRTRLFAVNAIDLVINLGMNGVYICIKNNDIFVFKDTNEELQMYSLKEFAKCCYGELCPWCLRLKIINDEGSNR